jgi:hypothetical protein
MVLLQFNLAIWGRMYCRMRTHLWSMMRTNGLFYSRLWGLKWCSCNSMK